MNQPSPTELDKAIEQTPRTDAEQFTRDLIYALRGELTDALQNKMPTFQDDVDTILPMVKEHIGTLERELNAAAENDRTVALLKEQIRVADVAFQHLFEQSRSQVELIERLVEALKLTQGWSADFGQRFYERFNEKTRAALQLAREKGYGKE